MISRTLKLIGAAWFYSASASAAATSTAEIASDTYTHPQQFVAIEGTRRLNLFCIGSGAPAVLFEAGSGSDSSTWRYVQAQVATFTRACSYDRAGLGFSDPPGRTVDASNVVDDVQRLINAAPIKTPLVLVGHSLGGLYDTLFAATHKDEVAGMVLVDPSFAHQFENFAAGFTPEQTSQFYATLRGMHDQMAACQALLSRAPSGKVPSANEPAKEVAKEAAKEAAKDADCLPSASIPEHPDPVLLATLTAQWRHPAPYDAMVSETSNFMPVSGSDSFPPADDGELDSASGYLGHMPLVVLTAAHAMTTFPGLTDAQRAQLAAAWKAGHAALAKRSTRGISILIADSGHFIQIDKPEAVVDAVRHAVEQARGGP